MDLRAVTDFPDFKLRLLQPPVRDAVFIGANSYALCRLTVRPASIRRCFIGLGFVGHGRIPVYTETTEKNLPWIYGCQDWLLEDWLIRRPAIRSGRLPDQTVRPAVAFMRQRCLSFLQVHPKEFVVMLDCRCRANHAGLNKIAYLFEILFFFERVENLHGLAQPCAWGHQESAFLGCFPYGRFLWRLACI